MCYDYIIGDDVRGAEATRRRVREELRREKQFACSALAYLIVICNQSPNGIMRSAVPLPCFIDIVKSQRVAGQRPQQGTKSCRMRRNSVRPTVCPSVCLSTFHTRGLRVCQRGLRASHRGLRACQRGLRASQKGLGACQRGLLARQRGLEDQTERSEGP